MAIHCLRLRGLDAGYRDKSWQSDHQLRIGRLADLEVVLEDSSISRRHAEVVNTEQGWVVRDLGSTNGTFINGVRIGRADHRVGAADVLECGRVKMRVEMEDRQESSPGPGDGSSGVAEALSQPWGEALEGDGRAILHQVATSEQMLALVRIGRDFGKKSSAEGFLQNLVQDAVTILGARGGSVFLADAPSHHLCFRSSFPCEHPGVAPPWAHARLCQEAIARGESLLYRGVPLEGSPGETNSVLCALLRSGAERLGVLCLCRAAPQPPYTPDDLSLADMLAATVSSSLASVRHFADQESDLFVQTLTALAQAIDLRDDYTGGHTQRVTDYAMLLAEELHLSHQDRTHIQVGTPLHDIGKIGISDAILRKPTPLTEEEFNYMKSHTWKGAAILETIPKLAPLIPIVRSHHERWDGTGYPDRLSGERIPLLGRIVGVADAFDAMTSTRPYRPGMPLEIAFQEIRRKTGSQFDPACAAAFLRLRPRLEDLMRTSSLMVDTLSREEIAQAMTPSALLGPDGITHTRRTSAIPRLDEARLRDRMAVRRKL